MTLHMNEITGRNLNVSGIATVGFITSSNAFYTGVVTATTFSGDLIGGVTGDVVGDVTGTASKSTTSSLSDESSDTTCFPTFATAASGDQALKTGTNLTFNSNTGDLAFTSATISDHTSVGSAVTASESGIECCWCCNCINYFQLEWCYNLVSLDFKCYRTGGYRNTFRKMLVELV